MARIAPFVTLAALVVATAGCSRARARGSVGDGAGEATLELVVAAPPEMLDPRFVTDVTGLRVSRLLHAGLVRLDDRDLRPRPALAESWTFRDAKTLVVTLRADARFASGAAVTPGDVVETMQALADPSLHARHARATSAIASVVAESERTVRFTLTQNAATILTDLEMPILRRDQARLPPGSALDGAGPFVVQKDDNEALVLAPNTFFAPAPSRRVLVRTVRDENHRFLRLFSGHTDILPNGLDVALVRSLEERGFAVRSRPGANLTYLVFRTDVSPFDDREKRLQIAQCVDRAALVRTLLHGRAALANGLVPPSHWAASAVPSSPEPCTPAAPFDAELLTSTDRARGRVAEEMAADLGRGGVRVHVRTLEFGTLLERLSQGAFEFALLQWPEFTEPNMLRVFLHSASFPPHGANRGRVSDANLDAALDRGSRELDESARRDAYREVDALVRANAYLVPLWHEDQLVVLGARARGFEPSAEGRWGSLATMR